MKKRLTTRKEVVEALIAVLLGDEKSPKIFNKIDGVAGNASSFMITFCEGKGFYTDYHINISEGKLFQVKEDEENE